MTGRNMVGACLILFASHVAFGQSAAAPPSFEVASVKPAAPQGNIAKSAVGSDPGRIAYRNVPLKSLITRAFGLKSYQISGPSWLNSEFYDVVAKIPDGSPKDQVPLMLQQLLTERFKLATHRETKELAVYALLVGKDGPKLGKADEKLPAGPPVPVAPGGGPPPDFGRRLEVRGMGTSELADGLLSAMLKRPVIDMTGIQGTYNFSLEFLLADPTAMGSGTTADTGPAPDSAPAPTIFNALQKLGLKLEARKEPVEMLIVDHAEKVPTEN